MLIDIFNDLEPYLIAKFFVQLDSPQSYRIRSILQGLVSSLDTLPSSVYYRISDILDLLNAPIHYISFLLLMIVTIAIIPLSLLLLRIDQSSFICFENFFTFYWRFLHRCIDLLLQHRVILLKLAGENHLFGRGIVYALLLWFDNELDCGHLVR